MAGGIPLAQESCARACPTACVGDVVAGEDFLTPCQWVFCSCHSPACPELR